MRRWRAAAFRLLLLARTAWAADPAQLENVKTEWQNAYGVIIYTILADVKNVSAAPLRYVKIKVVLLDKHGQRVAERDGYNMAAETLANEGVAGSIEEKLKTLQPIAPGSSDHFRLSFDKADIGKPFRTTQVSIIEVR